MAGSKILLTAVLLVMGFVATGQIESGKIIFERKTNLEKRFKDDQRVSQWLKGKKSKIDMFELYFNDTSSAFVPQPTEENDPMDWATNKNQVFQNFKRNEKLLILNFIGQEVFVTDSNKPREWKVTESKRNIGSYLCRKAVWQKDDSTRIYAWFTDQIVPSVGPEGFNGLPGAILGLATEDGGIIYFAKEVVEMNPSKEQLSAKEIKKKNLYTMQQLKDKLEKDYGDQPWGKRIFENLFRWY